MQPMKSMESGSFAKVEANLLKTAIQSSSKQTKRSFTASFSSAEQRQPQEYQHAAVKAAMQTIQAGGFVHTRAASIQ